RDATVTGVQTCALPISRNSSSGKSRLQGLAYFALVPVSFRTVKVSKSGFQRVSGGTDRRGCVGNQSAKPKHRHLAGPVVQRHSQIGRASCRVTWEWMGM